MLHMMIETGEAPAMHQTRRVALPQLQIGHRPDGQHKGEHHRHLVVNQIVEARGCARLFQLPELAATIALGAHDRLVVIADVIANGITVPRHEPVQKEEYAQHANWYQHLRVESQPGIVERHLGAKVVLDVIQWLHSERERKRESGRESKIKECQIKSNQIYAYFFQLRRLAHSLSSLSRLSF